MTLYSTVKNLDEKYHFKMYNRAPLLLMEGKGSIVKDSNEKEYIDMLAGIAVNSLGHCHPKVVNAIREQTEKLIHCTNIYYTEPQAKLAMLLVERSGLDRIFFCNSGTEAVEGALKLARKHGTKTKKGGKVLSFKDSFHGRTLGSLMATGQEKYRKGLDPLPEGFELLPFNNLNAVKSAISEDVCAILVEPVQGEGGIVPAEEVFLAGLRKICDDNNILLIFDEIQCGMGRTGHLFAYQGYDVIPDIVTVAKALGGGFPIGAVIAKDSAANLFKPGDHGTTFGGNPLACAAAYATVSTLLEEDLCSKTKEKGFWFMDQLRKRTKGIKVVKEVRGKGLMIGVVLNKPGKKVVQVMQKKGVLGNCTAERVIRFTPPLNISETEMQKAIDIFITSLEEVFGNE